MTATESADSTVARNVDLGTLNKSVVTVDTTGTKGTQDFSAANATVGTTLSVSGAGVATVTGSGRTPLTLQTAGVVHVIDAGAGTDTLNLTAAAGLADVGSSPMLSRPTSQSTQVMTSPAPLSLHLFRTSPDRCNYFNLHLVFWLIR